MVDNKGNYSKYKLKVWLTDYKKYMVRSEKESIGPKALTVLLLFEWQFTKIFPEGKNCNIVYKMNCLYLR